MRQHAKVMECASYFPFYIPRMFSLLPIAPCHFESVARVKVRIVRLAFELLLFPAWQFQQVAVRVVAGCHITLQMLE
jgi:hypothetical protein